MWLIYTLITVALWSAADIFYKVGAKPDEKFSHLKIFIYVGFVFGAHALFTLITSGINYNPVNIIKYLPVSIFYASSMGLSYFGLRFVDNSVSTPVEESGGAITALFCFFVLGQRIGGISLIGVILVSIGVILLSYFETKNDNHSIKKYGKKLTLIAFSMAFCYAILDGIGSGLDAYFLEMKTSPLLGVTESNIELVANVSYELMFFIAAVLVYAFIRSKGVKLGKAKNNRSKILAAIFETAGQYTYVFAMSGNAIVAAPVLSSVSIFAVIISVLVLKEKITKKQFLASSIALLGIVILAIAEVL